MIKVWLVVGGGDSGQRGDLGSSVSWPLPTAFPSSFRGLSPAD